MSICVCVYCSVVVVDVDADDAYRNEKGYFCCGDDKNSGGIVFGMSQWRAPVHSLFGKYLNVQSLLDDD